MTHSRAVVADMEAELERHPDDALMEQYALGKLAADAIPAFEQHLLICEACQDRMAEVDANVQAMQAETREIRLREKSPKAMCHGSGKQP